MILVSPGQNRLVLIFDEAKRTPSMYGPNV